MLPLEGMTVVAIESVMAAPFVIHHVPGDQPRMDPTPEVGQHTAAILAKLGFESAEVQRMRECGVLA